MRLTSQQAAAVKQELGADSLEEENPAMESLQKLFGDHTFYVGEEGLLVFERIDNAGDGDTRAQMILVAAWTDENKNALSPIEPQPTTIVVDLGRERGDA